MKRRLSLLRSNSKLKMDLHTVRALFSGLAFLALFTGAATTIALDVPPLSGRVNDYAGFLPSDRARALGERLARFEQQSGHQIAVLTIPSLEGEDIEGFSIKVAESWKIGKKGFDDGVILLIARNDRKLRIEVGYGLEGVLPDAIASRIIREVIGPYFRANDYAGGIEAGVEGILNATRGETLPEPARKRTRQTSSLEQILFILFLLAIPILVVLNSLTQRRAHGVWSGAGRRRSTGLEGPFLGGFGGGGFGGGDFGGGGGFSGGGGGFGGGGASGGW